ncbi:MAG: Sir2 family NAD-dependent protein deacetylase [Ferruginibacter sp.]
MKKVVVLTGAGISAESGLKTFRDSDGLWMGYNIEDVATPRAFLKDPQLVLNFYNDRRKEVSKAAPNKAHIELVKLEKQYDVNIITQNIDDLHERAGSSNVLHLHGEIFKMCSCNDTSETFPVTGDMFINNLAEDGGLLRPAIIWFEEEVPMIEKAAYIMSLADIFILVGTSLQVYPAAGLIHYLRNDIPKFIIDKKIPQVTHLKNTITLEMPATTGMEEVIRQLTA